MAKKLTLEEANQKIQSKHKHLTLITFNGTKKACEFIDSEYGEFTSIYRYVLSGESNHPERSKKNKYKKTFEQAFIDLQNRQSHLELITYNGSNSKCLIKDIEFGEFEAIYQVALSGKAIHIERKKTIHKKTAKSENTINKRKKTNLEKYGVESIFQSNIIKNKIKTTNLNKYGVEYPQQNADIQQKTKNTNLEKYGVENVFQSKEIKEKIKNTNLKKYETKSPIKNKEIKKQIKQTNLIRYGVENPQQNKFIKNNTMHTNLIKYGVKVPAHNKIIFEKIKNNKFNEGKWNSWYGLTSKEYSKNSIYSKDHLNYLRKHFTIQEIETFVKNKTNIEYKIINMLNRRNISYVYNELYNKKYKPDFIINNLIIECDGLYWHSNKFKDKYYHKNKKQYYDNNQIISLFFRENEILNKFNIVEHLICKELNLNDDIDINNYYCVETNDNSFLYENSINYNSDHLICQVIYNESVVCATNFKLIGNNLYLSNYCTKQFINIKKGLDKIIKYLLTKYDIEYIEYSANLRYEKSKIESNYNFIDCGTTYSFEWTDCKNTFNLNDKPTTKCYKIWDCGQKKFKLNL